MRCALRQKQAATSIPAIAPLLVKGKKHPLLLGAFLLGWKLSRSLLAS